MSIPLAQAHSFGIMTCLQIDTESLARHRLRLGRTTKGLRPVGFRLDSEGINLAVSLPGPDWLAAMLTLPGVEAYRDGARLLSRPYGDAEAEVLALSLPALADGLRDVLSVLPERADAGEPYRDLRLAASTSSSSFAAYLLNVVRAFVRSLPALPKGPKARQERRPAKTGAERVREHRERLWISQTATICEWLELFLLDEETTFGWVSGEALYDALLAFFENSYDPGDNLELEPDHIVAALPGRRFFYAFLHNHGGLGGLPRRRAKQGVEFLI